MYKVIVNNSYFVKLYEQDIFGMGVVHFTDNELDAGKFSEMIAREISAGLRELGKDTMMIRTGNINKNSFRR